MKMHTPEVEIYDTTLRDGSQGEGISFSCDDKLKIAAKLDEFGVHAIEGGWPGSNPKDAQFFARARELQWRNAKLAAFGSTRRPGVCVDDDSQLKALLECGAPLCTIFGKSSRLHVWQVLRTTTAENLAMVAQSVAFLRAAGREVIFDAEHFFDGFKEDPEFSLAVLAAAFGAGANTLVLCDTNGGSLPWTVRDAVLRVRQELPQARIGVHTHNDSDCAVSNALAAVAAGARHVQGTVNGYGERCGNANLCSLIPGIQLKLGLNCVSEEQLKRLPELGRFVAEIANVPFAEAAPYVGRSAFAHKGGVHAAAVRRLPGSYQHVEPTLVGNESRVLVSELAGRASLLCMAAGSEATEDQRSRALSRIKDAEARGLSFEAAEASVAVLLQRQAAEYRPPFRVLDYRLSAGRVVGGQSYAEATARIQVGEREQHVAAEGVGPVHALDMAVRKALAQEFPELEHVALCDYKVRIVDGQRATAAITRVLVEFSMRSRKWTTVGASANILDASLAALVDGYEFAVLEEVAAGSGASHG
jgi:2-isopropylmalate synthase